MKAKKLKKAIRARSQKTGESYTAARHQVLLARTKRGPAPTPPRPESRPTRQGPVSDASVLKETGHRLDHWFGVLDAFGAPGKGHSASAQHLFESHQVPGWHSQMITVAYERSRGLRRVNQASTGLFQVSVSKTVKAPIAAVLRAFSTSRRREQWATDPALRRALDTAFEGTKPPRLARKGADRARLRYPWNGSRVELRITANTKGGTAIVADNTQLSSPEGVEERRMKWRTALDSLKAQLGRP